MKTSKFRAPARLMATVMTVTLLFNSTVAVAAPRASSALETEVRTLRTSIDSGSAGIEAAIDTFSSRVIEKQITLDQLYAYVKTRTTAREFRDFKNQLDSTLNGIDPSTLRSDELAALLTQAFGQVRTDGLSWSGCVGAIWGGIIIVAAVVTFFTAQFKVKTDAEVKKLYENKRANSNSSFNSSIKNTVEWETSIPRRIAANESDITRAENRLRSIGSDIDAARDGVNRAAYELSRLDPESTSRSWYQQQLDEAQDDLDDLIEELRALPGRISGYEQSIRNLRALEVRYRANPDLVAVDVADYERRRDQAIVDLLAEEVTVIGGLPAEREAARIKQRNWRIGASVGAAIGGYFLIDGLLDRDDSCG